MCLDVRPRSPEQESSYSLAEQIRLNRIPRGERKKKEEKTRNIGIQTAQTMQKEILKDEHP